MIYTITFNPAIDLVIATDRLKLGDLNRVDQQDFVVGGKGINVSTLLAKFGKQSIATGFIGGFTGDFVKDSLVKQQISTDFVQVNQPTRINVKLKADSETEINGAGPQITQENFNQLYKKLSDQIKPKDTVFLMGNTANGLDKNSYTAICKLCQEKGAQFIVDTNKDLLTACLPYGPFLIKPNQDELSEIFKTPIESLEAIKTHMKKLQAKGARNVIVSRGGQGAVLLTESGDFYTSDTPDGQVVNSVGAGDSMVAGFMSKYLDTKDFVQSLKYGAASGSATAFSVGIAKVDFVNQLAEQIKIRKI